MTLGFSARWRSPFKHIFAFGMSSLPSLEDPIVDGDDSDGDFDGNV